MTLYFERYDGQAVTCDDFAQSIADANPGSELATRLPQFKRWYAQAGTPTRHRARPLRRAVAHLHARPRAGGRRPAGGAAAGAVRDPARDRPGRPRRPARWRCASRTSPRAPTPTERVLVLDEARAFFTFVDVDQPPVLSLLRGFSAPVTPRRRPRRRRPAGPAAPRQRSVQPLGSRPAPGAEPPARRGRAARRAGAARRRLHRGDARRAAPSRRSTRRSRSWC